MSEHDPPTWLLDDEEEDDGAQARRGWARPALVAAATLPWLVVGGLFVAQSGLLAGSARSGSTSTTRATGTTATGTTATGTTATGTTVTGTEPAPRPSAAGQGGTTLLSSPARTTPTAADAAAMAVIVARSWVTNVGPTMHGTGTAPQSQEGGGAYLEHAVVEGLDYPAPGYAVASVLGVVLAVDDGAYGDVAVRRLAVPLRFDADGARPAGEPWPLPPPDLDPAVPTGDPIDDAALATEAGAALAAAGFEDIEVLALRQTDSWPWLATVRARAPGAEEPREQVVWLRSHQGGFVVAGAFPPQGQEIEP